MISAEYRTYNEPAKNTLYISFTFVNTMEKVIVI